MGAARRSCKEEEDDDVDDIPEGARERERERKHKLFHLTKALIVLNREFRTSVRSFRVIEILTLSLSARLSFVLQQRDRPQ